MARKRLPRRQTRQSRAELYAGIAVWVVALSILPGYCAFLHFFIPGY